MMTDNRPGKDRHAMDIAKTYSARGTCSRAKVGAIVIVNDSIAAEGYNGAPRGTRHCDHESLVTVEAEGEDVLTPGDMENGHCSRAVHAEMNVVANAARKGVSLIGGTLYTTAIPCYRCAPLLIQVGIRRVVYENDYRPDPRALDMLREARVRVDRIDGETIRPVVMDIVEVLL